MAHVMMHIKQSTKLRQRVVFTMAAALVIGIYLLLAISLWNARSSTIEVEPLGPSNEALSPTEVETTPRFSRDPDAPGRRF